MRFFKHILLFFCLFSSVLFVDAQEVQEAASEAVQEEETEVNSLQKQFQYIKDKSNTYQEYKVVKISHLNNFWKNVEDSIAGKRNEFLVAQKEIEDLKAAMKKLQEEFNIQQGELQKGDYEKAHINVLGIDVLKSNYIYFNVFVIFSLIALLGITFYKFKGSKKIALVRQNEYEAIDKELNEHKIKAREKETKIKRELQTEMNRVQELTQEVTILRSRSASHS